MIIPFPNFKEKNNNTFLKIEQTSTRRILHGETIFRLLVFFSDTKVIEKK